jgi:hypothetical protein
MDRWTASRCVCVCVCVSVSVSVCLRVCVRACVRVCRRGIAAKLSNTLFGGQAYNAITGDYVFLGAGASGPPAYLRFNVVEMNVTAVCVRCFPGRGSHVRMHAQCSLVAMSAMLGCFMRVFHGLLGVRHTKPLARRVRAPGSCVQAPIGYLSIGPGAWDATFEHFYVVQMLCVPLPACYAAAAAAPRPARGA